MWQLSHRFSCASGSPPSRAATTGRKCSQQALEWDGMVWEGDIRGEKKRFCTSNYSAGRNGSRASVWLEDIGSGRRDRQRWIAGHRRNRCRRRHEGGAERQECRVVGEISLRQGWGRATILVGQRWKGGGGSVKSWKEEDPR
jgi:hypothetical protein